MKIDYQETTDDLLKRIDIHNQYGGRDIDQWMLVILSPHKGSKILDIGCGAGKLCFSFHNFLQGDCKIVGGDVSDELLKKARIEDKAAGTEIKFINLDFNKPFDFPDNEFDLVTCSFAIYYAENIPFTISEMGRILKPGGKLFTTGPMPENKQVFYKIIRAATGQDIPPMPGSSRYGSEILDAINNQFDRVEVNIFENPLTFKTPEPFIEYTRASLSEDRKLWKNLFQGEADFQSVMDKISNVAREEVDKNGQIIMTKVVGGFVGIK